MLHIINKSLSESSALASCLKHILPNSVVLLYENAVLNAVADTSASVLLVKALAKCQIYVLLPDLIARGIEDRIIPGVQKIDYEGFVDLVIKYKPVQSWI